jgi:hypothetical protein
MCIRYIGDVRHGFVESAWGRWEWFGQEHATRAALLEAGKRSFSARQEALNQSQHPEARFVPFETIHGTGFIAIQHLRDKDSSA